MKLLGINPTLHKPTIYTLKYSVITIHKMVSLEQKMAIFPACYDLILMNVNIESLAPDIELMVLEILNSMDIAYMMKYLSITPHKFIRINSFKYMLQNLIEPTMNKQYLGIINIINTLQSINMNLCVNGYLYIFPYGAPCSMILSWH